MHALDIKGAGKAGCWLHPWPACHKKSTRRSPQVQPDHPAFPAQWLQRGSFVLSPGTGLCCPRRHAKRASRHLTPASGCQDHTTSPSASASFVRTDQSARVAIASIAARLTFSDDWPSRPSGIEAGWRDKIMHFRKTESKIFFAPRLDGRINPASRCEHSFFFAHAVLARQPALHRPQHLQTPSRPGESVRVSVIASASDAIQKSGRERKAGLLRRDRASQ
jgi:hypothetical protein